MIDSMTKDFEESPLPVSVAGHSTIYSGKNTKKFAQNFQMKLLEIILQN